MGAGKRSARRSFCPVLDEFQNPDSFASVTAEWIASAWKAWCFLLFKCRVQIGYNRTRSHCQSAKNRVKKGKQSFWTPPLDVKLADNFISARANVGEKYSNRICLRFTAFPTRCPTPVLHSTNADRRLLSTFFVPSRHGFEIDPWNSPTYIILIIITVYWNFFLDFARLEDHPFFLFGRRFSNEPSTRASDRNVTRGFFRLIFRYDTRRISIKRAHVVHDLGGKGQIVLTTFVLLSFVKTPNLFVRFRSGRGCVANSKISKLA